MKWESKGIIFSNNQQYNWNKTHAQIPTVDIIGADIFRVYYSTRDDQNRSYTSYFDVSATNPSQIIYEHDSYILPLGESGAFDDCGVMPSSILSKGDDKYFYYIGWNVRNTIPYYLSIGLAIQEESESSFRKFGNGPVLGRNLYEPYLCSTPFVLYDDSKWHMWYMSGTGFETIYDRIEPLYDIKYAYSCDGIHWEAKGQAAIKYKHNKESICRPCVIKEDGIFKMWYTYRSIINYRTDKLKSYRIGYAESRDGIDWTRLDEAVGINIPDEGWDSQMQAYPYVIAHNNRKYMFYNGNGFGQSGIGYAILS
ncbi:MAG: hypothetical protein FWE14_07430 [Lachnospiraceae bacterium]|nr:hypothetical protein [Lachnospiraceae bacterium]